MRRLYKEVFFVLSGVGLALLTLVVGLRPLPVSAEYELHQQAASPLQQSMLTSTTTYTLYATALGTTPDVQGWDYNAYSADFPQPAQTTKIFSNGATLFDTTVAISDYAGFGALLNSTDTGGFPSLPTLNRSEGFTVNFSLQLISETHISNDRGGFSVIVLADDMQGIEVVFWEDEIWVQEDGATEPPLFTHAEGVSFDTTVAFRQYHLSILSDTYTLTASGMPPLTGAVRDYTSWSPPLPILPDPYETPNFIFLGDDSRRGLAQTRIGNVSVTFNATATLKMIYLPVIIS